MSRFSRSAFTAMLLCGVATLVQGQARPPAPFKADAKAAEIATANLAVLNNLTPVTDAMLQNPPEGDWLQWRRTYDEQGFSPLKQIAKENVSGLRNAWAWSLPPGTSEIAPIVHDGIMFVYGNMDKVQALNAANGDKLWEYARPAMTGPEWPGQSGTFRRNLTIYGDKIIFPTFDGHEVALDYKTGKLVWDHKISDLDSGAFRASSGPLAVKGKLMQGTTNCARLQAGGCFIVALDANTGAEAWRVYTIARPGEKGDDSWNGAPLSDRQGGGLWATGSYDPALNLVYFGTGNTYDWMGLVRGDASISPKKAALYTDSTLAIDPDTGKVKWHFQHMPQDMWNQDWTFEQIVMTVPVNGKPRKLLVTTGKPGITDAVDAATGKWVFSTDEGVQTIVKSIDPRTGAKTYNPDAIPDMTRGRTHFACPSGSGAKNWNSNSYDPATHLMYVPVNINCTEQLPRAFTAKDPYTGGEQSSGSGRYFPNSDGNIGGIDAIDLSTQKIVWSRRQRAPLSSAALATAGGVMFAGDLDRWFRAYDSQTGEVLWETRLNDSVHSFPISYSVNGRQYIAVQAGFAGQDGARLSYMHNMTPEVKTPINGGSIMWVFELPHPPGH